LESGVVILRSESRGCRACIGSEIGGLETIDLWVDGSSVDWAETFAVLGIDWVGKDGEVVACAEDGTFWGECDVVEAGDIGDEAFVRLRFFIVLGTEEQRTEYSYEWRKFVIWFRSRYSRNIWCSWCRNSDWISPYMIPERMVRKGLTWDLESAIIGLETAQNSRD
jgi:hypothetical protein